jgi:hypothetical protein
MRPARTAVPGRETPGRIAKLRAIMDRRDSNDEAGHA